jgi:hypothetical protein
MEVRITRTRAAMAALFVLAGVGLASILSPLVSSAFATAGQIVNVSDPTAPYTAKVDSTGALKTAATGTVAETLPRSPFHDFAVLYSGVGTIAYPLTRPTTATLAVTSMTFNAQTSASILLYVWERGQVDSSCGFTTASTSVLVGSYSVPGRDTTSLSFPTPFVLKPLQAGKPYCLVAQTYASDNGYHGEYATVTGYVPAGTYTGATPTAPEPVQAGRTMRRR